MLKKGNKYDLNVLYESLKEVKKNFFLKVIVEVEKNDLSPFFFFLRIFVS